MFEKAGVIPDVRMKSTNFEVVRTLVANGYGYSITVARPRNEAAPDGKPILSKPILNALPTLAIGTLSRKTDFTHLASALKHHIQGLITPANIPGMRPL